MVLEYLESGCEGDFGEDAIAGLSGIPKTLPPKYFYDRTGSLLFERICELPEYYPTRTETGILKEYAPEIAALTGKRELVELGSGSSSKTRYLLSAYERAVYLYSYLPIDISESALETSVNLLKAEYRGLEVRGLVGTYESSFRWLRSHFRGGRMIIFLGSTLGNFYPEERDRFFEGVVNSLEVGDHFLLGIDLQKDVSILEAAYNDSEGVTAAFNLNMLAHLNDRFDGNFNLDYFRHLAFYNREAHRIEMHLQADRPHEVSLNKLNLTVSFEAGETILTEISCKFNLEQTIGYLNEKGLKMIKTWTDEKRWFGLILCKKVD